MKNFESALSLLKLTLLSFWVKTVSKLTWKKDQRPFSIGRKGQNVDAAKLLNILDIKNFDDLDLKKNKPTLINKLQ